MTLSLSQAGRMTMYLLTDELLAEWNTALAPRKGLFVIDYTSHNPALIVGCANCKPEPWLILDTKGKRMLRRQLEQDDLRLMTDDLTARLAKHGARLQFVYERRADGSKWASLLFAAEGGNNTVAGLVHQRKRSRSKPFGQMALPEGW